MQSPATLIANTWRRALAKFNAASRPAWERSAWRESAVAQIWLCGALGIMVSAVTVFLHFLVTALHGLVFALPDGEHLSAANHLSPLLVVGVPVACGLILSGSSWLVRRWRSTEIVDPIEANAVYGGRLSVRDSARLLLATVISNAGGLSIGMEAAYTQIGAGITSRAGQKLRLRREDLRVFVAAGAAAAIAAAFNAPLAGAFYGFELVLGIYTLRALPHVAVAALASALFVRVFNEGSVAFTIPVKDIDVPNWHYLLFIAMGIFAARIGILTMKSVTACEKICKKFRVPAILRPALGGLVVGLLALAFPQVLGSGQGAIDNHLHTDWPLYLLAALLAAKILASAVSIGTGFRGGLFSASLFIGCLYGQLSGTIAGIFLPENQGNMTCFILVGMGAVAASIVGAPVTIILLVLEMTESFAVTTPVLAAVLISAIITRYSFGYSFSTWRFHLRGLRITGAFDVGWIGEMTVSQMMQTDFKTIPASATLAELRAEAPQGSARRVFLLDTERHFAGSIDVVTLHSVNTREDPNLRTGFDLAESRQCYLLPWQNIREALDLFSQWELEELPVLASRDDLTIIGSLHESYVLRRYTQELEAHNLAQSGAGTPVKQAVDGEI